MRFGSFFISSLLLAFSLTGQAWAVPFGIAHPASLGSQEQSYFERPDILTVEARLRSELNWDAWREAHLEAAAAFLELYPTEHLYFLARDAELLYDAVRLISRDDPATFARMHLLNVSRANMRDAHLLEYLAQEGITPERLRSEPNFQPIFIDTGFSGTIPRVISERMPEDVRSRLKTHLLVSSNPAMPSLRAFLRPINPAINGLSPSSMHGTIVGYEHIARATDRSNAYQQIEGQWHPTSNASTHSDGQVSTLTARQYQEDLRAHLHSEQAIATLQTRRTLWRNLRENWLTLSREQWIETLKSRLDLAGQSNPHVESAIRDFLDWATLIGTQSHPQAPVISVTTIGLSSESGAKLSNKAQLIAQHPQWAAVLENPDAQIPALLDSGQASTLGAILDSVNDEEIRSLAIKEIASRLDQTEIYALAEALMEKLADDQSWVLILFGNPSVANHPDLLRLAIEKATSDLMGNFATYTFSKSHWSNHPELLRIAIEKAASDQMGNFAIYAFNRTHWGNHPELLRIAIEKAPSNQMGNFARYTFNQIHWSNHPELLRIAIEKAPSDQMVNFATSTFSQSHWSNHPELLRIAIEKAPSNQMGNFAAYTFSQSHWSNHPELLRLAIEKATSDQMHYFARHTFKRAHWGNHPDLLRLAIEKAPGDEMNDFATFVFETTHWSNHPQIETFRAATLIVDSEQRRAYLREQLGPYPWESDAPNVCEQTMMEDAS